MPEIGDRRVLLTKDDDAEAGLFTGDGGDYSDVFDLVEETREKIRADEWFMYQIDVQEYTRTGWLIIGSMGSSVHNAGHDGSYYSPADIRDESLRDAVQGVWDEAESAETALSLSTGRGMFWAVVRNREGKNVNTIHTESDDLLLHIGNRLLGTVTPDGVVISSMEIYDDNNVFVTVRREDGQK